MLVFVLAGALGEGVATAAIPDGIGLGIAALSLASMVAYVAVVAVLGRRLRPELTTPALDLRRPVPPVPVPVA